jgi:hypothetical protein
MGQIAVIAYRPTPGCEAELPALTHEQSPHSAKRRIGDGSTADRFSRRGIVEIFEWVDGGPERAHTNPAVSRCGNATTTFANVPLANLPESQSLFAGSTALN